MNFKQHPLAYLLIPLCVVALGVSFHRFLIAEAYTVSYEGECDPVTQSCFVGCEDEICAEPYYYARIERTTAEIRSACGPDITDCDYAAACELSDTGCTVTYCSAETLSFEEECEDMDTDDAAAPEEAQAEESGEAPTEDETLDTTTSEL